MDLKESSNCDGRGCLTLHDDELLFLSKHYLKEQDCLSLAMSGVSDNYTSLYTANRKRLAIGRNSYHLTPTFWAEFFKGCVSPLSITTFDASHTYWLPAEVLVHSIVQMTNLEELCVHDTQVSLSHLPEIFQNCPKLVRISFTLHQKISNEDEMKKASLNLLRNGFAKLTQLKIFTFQAADGKELTFQSWLNLFQVLKWCRDCVDLVVKFASSDMGDVEDKSSVNIAGTRFEEQLLDMIEADLLPHLLWMTNLKSLAIFHSDRNLLRTTLEYPVIMRLFGLLLPEHKCLERLWVPSALEEDEEWCGVTKGPPFLKSLAYPYFNSIRDGLEGERFAQMEHVADAPIRRYDHLPHLKFFRSGYFRLDNNKPFNDFFRSVPKLEQLHFDPLLHEEELEGDWSLPLLKILKFGYRNNERFIQQVIQRCPNLELLDYPDLPTDYFAEVRLKYLKRLRISLSDGFNLPTIFEHCPKLESLHLSLAKLHFHQLSLCLPAAANLRDLRLRWKLCSDISPLILLLKDLLKNSSNLKYFERLVLDVFNYEQFSPEGVDGAQLEELIVPFAKGMTKLVCLGIIGFPLNPSAVRVIEKRLTEEVVPLRAAFWFHLGEEFPNNNDASVPRVHFEEIVNPIDEYFAPPDLLNLK